MELGSLRLFFLVGKVISWKPCWLNRNITGTAVVSVLTEEDTCTNIDLLPVSQKYRRRSVMAVNIPGGIAIFSFYLLVLGTGIWASFKSKREQKKWAASGLEMSLLGNRRINVVVGVLTMTGLEHLFIHFFLFFTWMSVNLTITVSGCC